MPLNRAGICYRKHAVLGALAIVLLLTSAAYAGPNAYLYTGNEYWGTINLTTGMFTVLGNTGVKLASTGEYKGTIYGADLFGDTLYRVNLANGHLTAIGNGSISYYDLGSTAIGLYGLGDNSDLYSINPATGATTLIGPTGVSLSTTGMSNGPGGLYMTVDSGADSLLYRLNTSTGKATLIGNTGVARIGALVWENRVLYAGEGSPGTNYL